MELIDLYVAEVAETPAAEGPRAISRLSCARHCEDMLDDRSRKAGRPVDEAMTLELLKEYGPPDKVAATYDPHPYLIGPRLYPFFIMVLKIVLRVLSVVLLVTLGIRLGSQPMAGMEMARAIGEGVLGILGAALQAFGNLVLVFAILERVAPASDFHVDHDKREWDPASLRKTAEPETIQPGTTIATIVFTVAALVIFNGYPELLGLHFFQDGRWINIPVLTDAFLRWMPFINVLWALQLALNLVLFRQGRWQPATRWTSLALDAAGIVIAYMLLAGPPIVRLSAAALEATGGLDAATAAMLGTLFQQAARIVLVVVVIAKGVQMVKDIVRQVLRRR